MKKQLLLIALCVLLANMVQAEDLSDFLPFIQAPLESQAGEFAQMQQLLMDFELELGQVERKVQGLEEQQRRLEGQIEGFQILGCGLGQLRRFQVTGSGAEMAQDFLGRPLWYDAIENEAQIRGSKANEWIALTIIGRPSPQIEVLSDLYVSSIWAGSPRLSTDNIAIRTNFNMIKTIAGTYWAEFTPLTLYYATYSPWFESSYFERRRDNWKEELGRDGNKRKLEGFYSEFNIDTLNIKGLMSRVRSKDGTSPFHRFLTGFSVTLFPQKQNFLGANWVKLADDPSTGSGKAASGELLGVNWNAKLWKNLSCNGEYVRSLYDDGVAGGLAAIPDRAVVGELRWQMNKLLLQTRCLNIGPYYYAPTSQSRQYDLSDLTIFGPGSVLSAMGTTINRTTEALPYGLGTPNRRGYQLRALYQPLDRILAAFERVDLNEIKPADLDGEIITTIDSKRHYSVERFGAEVDLTGFLKVGLLQLPQRQLKLLGQVEKRTTSRKDDPATTEDEGLSFTSLIKDLGLSYQLYPGWKLIWGQKITQNQGALENTHQTRAIGLEITISPQTVAEFSSKVISYADALNSDHDYQAKMMELALKAKF